MSHSQTSFPLSGVIGIVDSSKSQLDSARQFGLRCVEIRADLLGSKAGLSFAEVLDIVSAAKEAGLACLYTLRHADQGGTFNGSEKDRALLCSQALSAGADIIDLEHGTDSANAMLEKSAPMILSYHNFDRMLDERELAELSTAMESQLPAAVKIIPTGQSLADAAMMMEWVKGAGESVKRIGFSMGSDGACSRILALASGSPITYASFGDPVAPGQIKIKQLLQRYQCMRMSANTKVNAVVGDDASIDQFFSKHCGIAESQTVDDTVYIAFSVAQAPVLEKLKNKMRISDIVFL